MEEPFDTKGRGHGRQYINGTENIERRLYQENGCRPHAETA